MDRITTKQLHHETGAVLDKVERDQSFQISRNGKVIARIEPAAKSKPASWGEIMGPVWEAQKRCKSKVPNPILEERHCHVG